jgi:hypothetical protein
MLEAMRVLLLGALLAGGLVACSLRGTDGLQGGDGGSSTATGGSGGEGNSCNADLLTSLEHCGVCGHACEPGPCIDGSCVIYDALNLDPVGITSDETHLYVGGQVSKAASILRTDFAGTQPFQTFYAAGDKAGVTDVAISGPRLYLLDASEGRLHRVNKADGTALGEPRITGAGSFFIAAEAEKLCWTHENGVSCTVQDAMPYDVVTTAMQPNAAAGLAFAGSYVLYVDANKIVWRTLAVQGSTPTELGNVDGQFVTDLTYDLVDNMLFVVTSNGIYRGGADTADDPYELIRAAPRAPGAGLIHGDHYYWTSGNAQTEDGRLSRIPRDAIAAEPPPVEVLYDGTRTPGFMTVHGDYLYFTLSMAPPGENDFVMRRSLDAEPLFVEE